MALTQRISIPGQPERLDKPHRLHDGGRTWTQTNCYVDLWLELLHMLGFDAEASTGFTLSSEFEGTQWTFLKPPPEDLRFLYGLDVGELNIWRPVRQHVAEQMALGALVTVEVDAYYLPDTVGDAYHRDHVKTTIVPLSIDVAAQRVTYLHNTSSGAAVGDDFEGLLPRFGPGDADYLPPYVERIRLESARSSEGLATRARQLASKHVARRLGDNPLRRMGDWISNELPDLVGGDQGAYHRLMFATCRQCGAAAELAADHAVWLDEQRVGGGSSAAAVPLRAIAEDAKSIQYMLARLLAGRVPDIRPVVDRMAASYDEAMAVLRVSLGVSSPD
jgi:hypothetical protein